MSETTLEDIEAVADSLESSTDEHVDGELVDQANGDPVPDEVLDERSDEQ